MKRLILSDWIRNLLARRSDPWGPDYQVL